MNLSNRDLSLLAYCHLYTKGRLGRIWENYTNPRRSRKFPVTAPVILIGLIRLKKWSTEKKTSWDGLLKGDRFESLRMLLAKFYSIA